MSGVTKRQPAPEPTVAKKMKTGQVEPEEFYALEDEIARRRPHSDLETAFLKESSILKKALQSILSGESKEPPSSKVVLNVAKMRRLSRLAQYSTAQLKAQSSQCLEQAEAKYLQLQNVNSEIQHLQKEIARCLQFSSGEEDIELVPEEEFYAEAPESISQPEQTRADEHAKHLARLNWELTQRKQLVGTLAEQDGLRGVLISDINGKEQRLKSLKPKIDALIKAAKPVQDVLGVRYTCTSTAEQRSLFSLLPNHLSVLYVQAEAYKDIMDDSSMEVTICGSVEKAHKWASRHQTEEEERDNSDEEGAEMDESENRRERTCSSRLTTHKEGVLEPHPIYLQIRVECEDGVKVGMKLQYLPDLRVSVLKYEVEGKLPVYANICSSDTLFDNLFPGDDGSDCPDPVGAAKLEHLGLSVDSFAAQLGRPYAFVQNLSGAGSDEKARGVHLADAVQRLIGSIRERVASRIALVRHLKALESCRLSSPNADDFPKKVLSELTSFKHISAEEFATTLSNEAAGDLPVDCHMSGFHFAATFENRTSAVKSKALIMVPVSYPREVPVFSILIEVKDSKKTHTSSSNHLIRSLERFVNISCLESISIEIDSVLLHQMASLSSRLDVMADLDPQLNQTSQPPNHLYTRTARGRDGELPLSYTATANSFTFQ